MLYADSVYNHIEKAVHKTETEKLRDQSGVEGGQDAVHLMRPLWWIKGVWVRSN